MLEPQDYQAGRQITMDGHTLDVHGTIQAQGGNAFLIVSEPTNYVCGIIPVAAAAESGEPVAVEDTAQARQDVADNAPEDATIPAESVPTAPAPAAFTPEPPSTAAPTGTVPPVPPAAPVPAQREDLTDTEVDRLADALYSRIRADQDADRPQDPVTDVTDVTGPQDPSPSAPDAPPTTTA